MSWIIMTGYSRIGRRMSAMWAFVDEEGVEEDFRRA
jgi:hypothetical protein